jgi:hypothetical protein
MTTIEIQRLDWTEELEHSEALDGFTAAAMTMQILNDALGEFLRSEARHLRGKLVLRVR